MLRLRSSVAGAGKASGALTVLLINVSLLIVFSLLIVSGTLTLLIQRWPANRAAPA